MVITIPKNRLTSGTRLVYNGRFRGAQRTEANRPNRRTHSPDGRPMSQVGRCKFVGSTCWVRFSGWLGCDSIRDVKNLEVRCCTRGGTRDSLDEWAHPSSAVDCHTSNKNRAWVFVKTFQPGSESEPRAHENAPEGELSPVVSFGRHGAYELNGS